MKEKFLNIIEKLLFYITFCGLIAIFIIYILLAFYNVRTPGEPIAKEVLIIANISIIILVITTISFVILIFVFGDKDENNDYLNSYVLLDKKEYENLCQRNKNQRKELSILNKLIRKLKKQLKINKLK